MPLPTSRELRELLTEATPGPWDFEQLDQQWAGCPPSTEFWAYGESPRDIAAVEVIAEYHDQTERNFTLISLAPQLAEEVIRLREEIAGVRQFCRDGMKVSEAEARLTDHEREKAWREGRWAAYYDVIQELDKALYGEKQSD